MKNGYILLVLLLVLVLASCAARDDNIEILKDSVRDRSIPYGIWVPNVEEAKEKFPLVMLSHGTCRWFCHYKRKLKQNRTSGFYHRFGR